LPQTSWIVSLDDVQAMACPLAWVPNELSCISRSICSTWLGSTHWSNTISWFLLYRTSPFKRKLATNLRSVLLSFSEAPCGYSLSLIYLLILKYQGLSSFSSFIKQQWAGLLWHLISILVMCHYFLLFLNPFCHQFNYWLTLIVEFIIQFYRLGPLD